MIRMTVGRLRGLQQLANWKGLLTMCALDHRGALRNALNKENPEAVTYQDMVDFKLDLCQVMSPIASAVLLDPVYGAAQAIASGVLPGQTGLLISAEETGYTGAKIARHTKLLPGWNARKAKKMGAAAVKLLVYFRPDLGDVTERQLKLVAGVAEECTGEDMPLLVETVSYPATGDEEDPKVYADKLPGLVAETAKQMTALPIDVLKAEFPGNMRFEQDEQKLFSNCRQLDQSSRAPWVLLSGGVEYNTFRKQVEIACRAGASGFLAGRALWQEAVDLRSRSERMDYFRSVAAQRLKEITEIANDCGTPWYTKGGCGDGRFDIVAEGWYRRYR